MDDRAEVSLAVAAPPEVVYDLVADVPRMGEWSPECRRCTWVGSVSSATEGARFVGYNRLGTFRRWITMGRIVVADPGRELSFEVYLGPVAVALWTYRMEADGAGGCTVTESYLDRRGSVLAALSGLVAGVPDRPSHNTEGMRQTLERLKAEAEARVER